MLVPEQTYFVAAFVSYIFGININAELNLRGIILLKVVYFLIESRFSMTKRIFKGKKYTEVQVYKPRSK
jgi:hypothetical protein